MLKIIVCLKQVPDSARIKIDAKTGTLMRAGVPSILNPYDHFALSQALKIKKNVGAHITVLSMGPQQAQSVLRLALGLGADKGILLSDRAFAGSDTWATAYALSCAIKKIGQFDLILCGQMAIDGDTAQTGPEMAFHLQIPQVTFCDALDVSLSAGGAKAVARKLIYGGYQIMEADLPALITLSIPDDYVAQYPSFAQAYQGQLKPLEVWSAQDIGSDKTKLGLDGSPTRVSRIFAPPQRPKCALHKLSPQEAAQKIYDVLLEKGVIK